MMDKEEILSVIERLQDATLDADNNLATEYDKGKYDALASVFSMISLLPEESVTEDANNKVEYASVESAIKAHAETYSFNIESELFNQLNPEQQALWRKEIEQAVVSGGYCGIGLARDKRYKENEEPVSEELEQAAVEAFKEIVDDGRNSFFEIFKAGAKWQKEKDGSITEDLGEYINELSKQFPMETPEKIYLNFGEITKEEFEKSSFDEFADVTWCQDKVFENDVEYIRKDIVDNMLKTAEEAMREKMMEKAVEWLRKNWRDYINTDKDGVVCFGHWQSDFRKAMSKN